MLIVEASHISKRFGSIRAVDDLSFDVQQGEIFALLGPNGAGKTTTIRIILDIFKPEHGWVAVLGGPMTEAKKERIGYMPEERGLYQDIPLERALLYLASLKGINPREARQRADELLTRFDLAEHQKKKVKELSKGMQQKAQIIATILHKPELIIIDEPFSGLDPVNTQMVKSLLDELRQEGATIIMSTHQMHQVEEMCDRILLINNGRGVLYGKLEDIRKQFSGHAVLLHTQQALPSIPGVERVEPQNSFQRLSLAAETKPQEVLSWLIAQGILVEHFEIAMPTLDEIFIKAVQADQAAEARDQVSA